MTTPSHTLGLRAGDWVEVRAPAEILATLDPQGRLDNLPFMPEMLQYCGKRFRVYKSAHKTCDTIQNYRIPRRMANAVHLEGLRCDGSGHDGCQAGCLIFWKEAWLKPATGAAARGMGADAGLLHRAARADSPAGPRYVCQATEMLRATTPFRWWHPGPYLKDLTSRNVSPAALIGYLLLAAYNTIMRLYRRTRRFSYPFFYGKAQGATPVENLNLQPGELVQVRSKEEIMLTLGSNQRNRGLSFDVEMVPYCGKTYRVLRRVEKLVDERTGKMISPPTACIVLDGVVCGGCLSSYRLFCPRSIYSYWREIWLRRVAAK
jgi:hypothetical protein